MPFSNLFRPGQWAWLRRLRSDPVGPQIAPPTERGIRVDREPPPEPSPELLATRAAIAAESFERLVEDLLTHPILPLHQLTNTGILNNSEIGEGTFARAISLLAAVIRETNRRMQERETTATPVAPKVKEAMRNTLARAVPGHYPRRLFARPSAEVELALAELACEAQAAGLLGADGTADSAFEDRRPAVVNWLARELRVPQYSLRWIDVAVHLLDYVATRPDLLNAPITASILTRLELERTGQNHPAGLTRNAASIALLAASENSSAPADAIAEHLLSQVLRARPIAARELLSEFVLRPDAQPIFRAALHSYVQRPWPIDDDVVGVLADAVREPHYLAALQADCRALAGPILNPHELPPELAALMLCGGTNNTARLAHWLLAQPELATDENVVMPALLTGFAPDTADAAHVFPVLQLATRNPVVASRASLQRKVAETAIRYLPESRTLVADIAACDWAQNDAELSATLAVALEQHAAQSPAAQSLDAAVTNTVADDASDQTFGLTR